MHYLNASALEINNATPHAADVLGASIDSVQYERFGNVVWELQATNRSSHSGSTRTPPPSSPTSTSIDRRIPARAGPRRWPSRHLYSLAGQDMLESTGPTILFKLDRAVPDPDGTGPLPALAAGDLVVGRAHTVNVYDWRNRF